MKANDGDRIAELFEDGRAVDEAVRQATREAVRRHLRLGNPVAVWEGGKVVWIVPADVADDLGES